MNKYKNDFPAFNKKRNLEYYEIYKKLKNGKDDTK